MATMNRDQLQQQVDVIVAEFMHNMAVFKHEHQYTLDEDEQSNAAWVREVFATAEAKAQELRQYIWD